MSSILQTLKRAGNIALWHDYRAGHARDFSGNGNHGTVVNDGWFDANGFNTTYLGNETILVSHSASINLDTFTVVGLIKQKRIEQMSSNLPQLARKHTAGNLSWSVRVDGRNGLIGVDNASGVSNWVYTRATSGVSCIGLNLETGNANTPLYFDGLLEAASGSAAPTFNLNAGDLYIANIYVLNRGLGRSLSAFLLFNKLLSADEHRQVYLELLK